MNSNHTRLIGATVAAGLAISLSLSACGPQTRAENAAAGSAAPSPTSSRTLEPSPSASQAPVPGKTATTAVPSPEISTETVQPALPVQATFTFPDRHISFSYPASWSVRTQVGPGRQDPPWQPFEAIVSDGGGNDLFSVTSGGDGIGCTGGTTRRTVLDKAPVPGMREADGTTPIFGFVVENNPSGGDRYSMTVSRPKNFEEGDVVSGCSLLRMANGGTFTRVIFNDSPRPAFPGREAAKSWMATEQYAQLKALMMSLSYS